MIGLLPRSLEFDPGPLRVRFVVDRVALAGYCLLGQGWRTLPINFQQFLSRAHENFEEQNKVLKSSIDYY